MSSYYRHYSKGGKYYVLSTTRRIQVDNEWVQATTYSNEDGEEFVRSTAEFNSKFTRSTDG